MIQLVTIPNVLLNLPSTEDINSKVEFYSGDWESFNDLLSEDNNEKYDLILTCETIYNTENQSKLHKIFTRHLKTTGVG